MSNDDDGEVIIYRGCARPGDTNFATVRCVDEEIVDYLEWRQPIGFSDAQLAQLFAAAGRFRSSVATAGCVHWPAGWAVNQLTMICGRRCAADC